MFQRGAKRVQKRPKIVLAAGGSGGHLFPAEAIADELEAEFLFMASGLATTPFFRREKFPFVDVASGTPFGKRAFTAIIALVRGVVQTMRHFSNNRPDLVVGFGSYHSAPVLIAALLKRVPILLFEANVIPGKVNQLFAPFAKVTAIQFEATRRHLRGPSRCVERPLGKRGEKLSPKEARTKLGLDPNLLTLFIFGGSQGAMALNEKVTRAIDQVRDIPFQVIHLTGHAKQLKEVEEVYRKGGVRAWVREFESDMATLWSCADFAICRAGAGTVAEQIAFEIPALFIPYPHAYNHQRQNAAVMERCGGGVVVDESALSAQKLALLLREVLAPEHLAKMRRAIAEFKGKTEQLRLADLIVQSLR
jgi:UDP-N-acetylglucosamine--N-acetylmuramyl-(pentapeptide) pyrophosphoryl-undecaprenol N-acetylglucosamine transferase